MRSDQRYERLFDRLIIGIDLLLFIITLCSAILLSERLGNGWYCLLIIFLFPFVWVFSAALINSILFILFCFMIDADILACSDYKQIDWMHYRKK